jgi:hypothetical protein
MEEERLVDILSDTIDKLYNDEGELSALDISRLRLLKDTIAVAFKFTDRKAQHRPSIRIVTNAEIKP